MRRGEVSHNLRGTLLASPRNSSNSFRITSLADPHHLTPTESHPYEKTGEGGTRSACPPVFRTFFQVPYPLSLVFSHSSKNDRGGLPTICQAVGEGCVPFRRAAPCGAAFEATGWSWPWRRVVSNSVLDRSMAHSTASSRSATPRNARPCECPRARSWR